MGSIILDLFYNAVSLDWVTDPVTEVQYQRNTQAALTWHQARKSCQQQGADLLSIVELHEQSYISGANLQLESALCIHTLSQCEYLSINMYVVIQG